jgi:hypothetical protein
MGDFNLIISPQDRNKSGENVSEMLLFNEAISNLGLVDIPLKGIKYTWSNMQDSPLFQRLDCFFHLWLGQPLFLIPWQCHLL